MSNENFLSLQNLNGVGPKTIATLERMGICSILDLLFHLPLRYQNKSIITAIKQTQAGLEYLIEGELISSQIKFGRRRTLICTIADETDRLTLRFFHFNRQQQESLKPGCTLRCYGMMTQYTRQKEMVHPEYRIIDPENPPALEAGLMPIYPKTEGLQQRSLLKLSEQAIQFLNNGKLVVEILPEAIREKFRLSDISLALLHAHRPDKTSSASNDNPSLRHAQNRLAFEELLAHRLSLSRIRQKFQDKPSLSINTQSDLPEKFISSLPFALTPAQKHACLDIENDLAKPYPMLRLVQGDVGCGKTIVAANSCAHMVANGYQAAVMAPTEILAEQHYINFVHWFEPLGISVLWLSGKMPTKQRRSMLEQIQLSSGSIIVGTHALFQEDVCFHQLGLVVIDEQHRFGVHQRLALKEKAQTITPHQLIMTATPIPRTLSMSVYANLDHTIIDELPPGRQPVITVALPNTRRHDVIDRIQSIANTGQQIYWVCTLIEESETLQCQTAEDCASELKQLLKNLRIGLIHGRLKKEEKETIMQQFKAGEIDVLVATTVIEVGVDVPNAALIVIENPERLGLAQLHQLRGRVGRGDQCSHCVLLYQSPLSEKSKARLDVMRTSNDGFAIAEKDLAIRGPGEVLGTRQSGLAQFKVADLLRDSHMLPEIQFAANAILENYEDFVEPLIARWVHNKEKLSEV